MPACKDAGEIYEKVFAPIIKKKGKHICRYPEECARVQDAKVHAKAMAKEDDLLDKLYQVNKGMLFLQTAIQGALDEALEKHNHTWRMSAEDTKDWKETILRRVRNLSRVVSQPLLKGKAPGWMKKLTFYKKLLEELSSEQEPDDELSEADDDEEEQEVEEQVVEEQDDDDEIDLAELTSRIGSEANKKPAAKQGKQKAVTQPVKDTCVVQFCKENMIAVRFAIGKPKDKALSFGIADDTDKLGSDIVMATFKDGTSDPVPGLTYDALRGIIRKPTASLATGILWSSEHAINHHLVHISQRVDRCLLLSVYEQSCQRMQVRMDKFGPIADQSKQLPPDSDVLQRALAFVKPIAERFASGEIDAKEMTALRNNALSELPKQAKVASEEPAKATRKAKSASANAADESLSSVRASTQTRVKRTKTMNDLPEYEHMSEEIPIHTSMAFERLGRFLE